MIHQRLFLLIQLFLSLNAVWAQQVPHYNIKARLDPVENKIHVVQKIRYTHIKDFSTKEIYLNDWNNAYSSTESPLAKRLVEEYNRSFYLSKKSKRGATLIESLEVNGTANKWERLENHIDIIKVTLEEKITKGTVVKLKISYILQLPDAKFTGYGITDNITYFLENIFLSIAWLKSKEWAPISHLDLEDTPNSIGDYNIVFSIPNKLKIASNLTPYKEETTNYEIIYSFKNRDKKQLLFQIGTENDYSRFSFDRKEIFSNLKANDLSEADSRYSLKKINAFLNLNNTLGSSPMNVSYFPKKNMKSVLFMV